MEGERFNKTRVRKTVKTLRLVPVVLELVEIAIVGVGIGVEVASHAAVGNLVITVGSLLVAAGGVIWGKFMRGDK